MLLIHVGWAKRIRSSYGLEIKVFLSCGFYSISLSLSISLSRFCLLIYRLFKRYRLGILRGRTRITEIERLKEEILKIEDSHAVRSPVATRLTRIRFNLKWRVNVPRKFQMLKYLKRSLIASIVLQRINKINKDSFPTIVKSQSNRQSVIVTDGNRSSLVTVCRSPLVGMLNVFHY